MHLEITNKQVSSSLYHSTLNLKIIHPFLSILGEQKLKFLRLILIIKSCPTAVSLSNYQIWVSLTMLLN